MQVLFFSVVVIPGFYFCVSLRWRGREKTSECRVNKSVRSYIYVPGICKIGVLNASFEEKGGRAENGDAPSICVGKRLL